MNKLRITALTLLLLVIQFTALVAQERKPNIILIMADDMGQECLGTYGSTYKTPHLDQLAKEGVKFNYAFSQPLCTPTRVQIMTGKYNYKNYSRFGLLNQNEKTFGNLVKEAGYVTAIAGKWQLGFNNKLPQHFGFDNYCLWQLSYPRNKGERYSKALVERDGVTLNTTDNDYGPDIFADYLLNFIEKNKDRPFLAYYPMALVHDPFYPTPDSPLWADDVAGRQKGDTLHFKDMVNYTDKIVGRIIDRLKVLGLYENTVIIFTGDNGTGRSIITPMKDGSVVKGGKGLTVSRGHHVPFIVNWGSGRYKKHETNDLVDFTDILPTIGDIIGQKVPSEWNTDGVSIYPQIKGEKGKTREWIFSHYSPNHVGEINKNAARFYRNHRYKLYSDQRFYDVVADPDELQPIAKGKGNQEAEKVRSTFEKLLAQLPAWQLGDADVPEFTIKGLESKPLTK